MTAPRASFVLRRRLVLAALGVLPAHAWAQGTTQGAAQGAAQATPKDTMTPESFLRGIYTPYPNQDFKGQPYWQVDRFFAPDLARAIEADMREAKRRGEVPSLSSADSYRRRARDRGTVGR